MIDEIIDYKVNRKMEIFQNQYSVLNLRNIVYLPSIKFEQNSLSCLMLEKRRK